MRKINFLAPLDKYGVAPSINWKGRVKTFSFCGIFATFLILASVITFAVLFSSDMVHKTNPAQTQSVLYGGLKKETRVIDDNVFKIGFGLVDLDTDVYYQDETIYSAAADLVVYSPDTGYVRTPIDLETCSTDSDDDLYMAYCFAKTQTHLSSIYLAQGDFATVEITLDRCLTSTATVTCASTADMEDKIFYSYFNTAYSVWSVDPSNYKQPVSRDLKDEWYDTPGPDSSKKLSIELMAIEFSSDEGWVTKSNKAEEIVTYERSQIDFIDSGYEDTIFFFNLRMSGNKASYSRQYQKIQSVLAQISGTMGLITIVIGLVAVPYARNYMYGLLINEAFRIVEKGESKRSAKRRSQAKQNMIQKAQNKDKNTEDAQSQRKENSITTKAMQEHQFEKLNIDVASPPILIGSPNSSHIVPNPRRLHESRLVQVSQGSRRQMSTESGFQVLLSPQIDIVSEGSPKNPVYLINDSPKPKIPQDLEFRLTLSEAKAEESTSNIYQAIQECDQSPISNEGTPESAQNSKDQAQVKKAEIDAKEHLEQNNEDENGSGKTNTIGMGKPRQRSTPFRQWLTSKLKSSTRSKAFAKGKSEILKNVDVFSIIRRFQEIDNLKACLLTEHQRVIFDNIAKPSLVINSDRNPKDANFVTVEGWDESYQGDKDKLCKAYKSLVKLEKKTEIDRQILELFENGLDDDEFDELEALF